MTFLSAAAAAAAIRRREISSVELTQQALDRIDRLNPSINAIVQMLKESAMGEARAADAALAQGKNPGALHGVPITIKDGTFVAGVPATAGVLSLKDFRPAQDSLIVRRLRAAGAVIVGVTNVPFMLADWQSYNDIYGTTNNPWNLSTTPGGSSGGSAAALAAGLGHLSIGTDIAGSIRVPAHFCGVYGHKPTLNLVPQIGRVPPLPDVPPGPPGDLSVAGPMARSADDLRLALEIIAGPSDEEAIAYSWRLPPARASRLQDYRIGFVLDDPACPVTSDGKEVLSRAVDALRNAGVKLEQGWPSGFDPQAHFLTYRYLLSAFFAGGLKDDEIEDMRSQGADPAGGMRAVQARAWTDPHKRFQAANRERIGSRAVWQRYFQTHDVFLMPTAFVPAFAHDHSRQADAKMLSTVDGPREYMDMTFWTSFATLAGLPATTAPIGLTSSGLPVGIQILGPYLEDATPIDVAARMADVVGGFAPSPLG